MNTIQEPVIPLSTAAAAYYKIISRLSTRAWNDIDNATACVASRSLALMDTLFKQGRKDFYDIYKKTRDGLRSLNLKAGDLKSINDRREQVIQIVTYGP